VICHSLYGLAAWFPGPSPHLTHNDAAGRCGGHLGTPAFPSRSAQLMPGRTAEPARQRAADRSQAESRPNSGCRVSYSSRSAASRASGTLAVTVVPTPGREVTLSRPPISSARSAIEASP
jgi:hypothetical protein